LRTCGHSRTGDIREDFRFRSGQLEKTPRLFGDLAEVTKTQAFSDDVEKIAMLAGCGIRLMFNCT
jgi:hypothetical protein